MSHATILIVGDEVLSGRIADANGPWLASRLRDLGLPVERIEVVADRIDAISDGVRRALERTPVVIATGGLGPTEDDVTRRGLAEGLGVGLVHDDAAEAVVRGFFERAGREVRDRDLVQARLPEGARPLENPSGSAPGIHFERDGRHLVVLPGVPHEMRLMFDGAVRPLLLALPGRGPAPHRREVTLVGVPEAAAGERLADFLARGRNPSAGSYPGASSIVFALEAVADDPEEAERLLDDDVRVIRERLGDAVLGEGRLELAEVVGERLIERGRSLALAESLTGGLVTDLLVRVPGISAVLDAGLVTYANAAKVRFLGVHRETLVEHGAVSEICAREMAEGVRAAAGVDLGVSTTGIAGPTGAVPGKPVGTVFVAVASADGCFVERHQIPGDRLQVRERAAHRALDLLRRHLD